jgi:hypothetical protein
LTTGAAYAFLGVSISLVFLNLNSKKMLFALALVAIILLVPSFVSSHAYDAYNLNKPGVVYGMAFTGEYIQDQDSRIITPFGNQL